jgi:CubicO group peptidase (beta-lactamase class C family)
MNAQLAAYRFPGAQVAVVRGDQILFLKGYGYADLERKIPVDAAKTLFQPGSISKLFTWTAVMQQVEQGKLDLDMDINTYLSDFQIPATFPQPITLRHLMTHTPGFEDYGIGIIQYDVSRLMPLGEYLAKNIPTRVYPPGEVSAYSNYGASLAGYIVSQVANQPFEQYITDHILTPLGMIHSTFSQPLPDDLLPDLAVGYTYANSDFIPMKHDYANLAPAGALSSTAADIARFMLAHLQNGRFGQGRILQEATAQEMHRHQYSDVPGLGGMTLGFMESQIDGQRLILHGGDTSTFHSLLALDLDHQVGLYVSYNGSGIGSAMLDGRSNLLMAFMERYLPVQPSIQPLPKAEFTSQVARFSGYYYPARSNFTSPEKIFNLIQPIQVSVDSSGELLISYSFLKIRAAQVGAQEFQQVDGEHQRIVFVVDAAGHVTGLALENFPAMYIHKTPWYGNPLLHQFLLLACLLVFMIGLVSWPRRLFIEHRALPPLGTRSSHLALWIGFFMALFNLLFVVGTGMAFIQLMATPVAVPPLLIALMWLPVLTSLLALAMLVMVFMAWSRRWWNATGRWFYTLGAATAIVFTMFVAYWNLWAL